MASKFSRMKKTVLLFLLAFLFQNAYSQLNMQLLDQHTYPVAVNDVWGWADPNSNAEYAIVGTNTRVSIVDITTPTDIIEVEFIPGPNSTWRDIKSWGNHVYVTNESSGGVLVIDMSGAPDNITWTNWSPTIPGLGNLTRCHNLYIDEYGYCYLAGCNINSGGIIIANVFSNPGNPVFDAAAPAIYAHDVFAQNNIMYASEIYGGDLGIYDVSNKQNINLLASQPTPYNFTHNAWVNADNSVVFTTDEKANAPVTAYDISDLNDIRELDQFRPIATLNANVIPHNVHVWDNWLIISYYTDGGIIADASRPDNIIEVGNWDTFLGGNGGFSGCWGAYPFLPSGLVLLSDRQSGLMVCGADYVRACWLEGKITNAVTGASIFGAEVNIASNQANFATSNVVGNYKTGQAIPGTFDVTFSAMGYISKTVPAVLENGVLTILDVQLEPIIAVDEFSGAVVSAIDGSPIATAQVVLESETFRFTTITDLNGQFTFNNIFRDEYTLAAAKWGHQHVAMHNVLIEQNTDPITLEAYLGYQDDFFVSQGWTTQTTASSGWWTRGIPIGTNLNGNLANPDADIPNDIGNQCFMTGNNGGAAGNDDVDDGYVRLISPAMDFTIYYEPIVSYNTWFFNGGNTSTPNDSLQVRISNGVEEVVLETITLSNSNWNARSSFKVSDYLAITNNMKIIFETADDVANGHVVEAAVDAFLVTESDFPMFEWTTTEGCPVLEVGFDESSDYAYQWSWIFENGDPAVSNNQNEVAGFNIPGLHDVSLEVTTKTGAVFTLNMPDLINVLELPVSGFEYTDLGGQVTFENNSTNATSYFWSFNDGSGATSNLQNPTHVFTSAGSYDVTLAATNDCGTAYFTGTVVIDAVPPTANFSSENEVGCGPLTVQFMDLSSHQPTNWEWSFPGGTPSTSSEQNPQVVYSVEGVYSVQLIVTNAAGSSDISQIDIVIVEGNPIPDFTFEVAGPEVIFTNLSINGETYEWQFNDGSGSTSNEANPTYNFTDLGDFEVILIATNDCGTVSYAQTITITAVQPAANFSTENAMGCAPLVVQFYDQSVGGEISNWYWSFPGGTPSNSTEQNPVVSYSTPGLYDASLLVTNSVGADEMVIFDAVTITDSPVADFTFETNGSIVDFSSILLNADSWLWHFGDPNQSTAVETNPSFDYKDTGSYTVRLEATNECGTTIIEQVINISAIAPIAAFAYSSPVGCGPLEIAFNDISSGGGISNWEWAFPGGNPAVSSEKDPVVTYTQAGSYDVTLKVTNPVGEDEITTMNLVVVDDVPTPDFTYNVNGPVIEFTNQSINATSQTWYFGDGVNSTSNEENPVFVYGNIGEYTVILETSNACGTSSISQEITVDFVFPNAAINHTLTQGCAPLEVSFMDVSSGGGIITWEWNFPGGNPATSTEQNQTVTYNNPGVYDVSLKITNPVGENEITLTELIHIEPDPEANFAFSVNGPVVQFTNLSNFGTTYEWEMGDGLGVVSTELNPSYVFPAVGEYEVSLSTTNACGTSVYSQTILITSTTDIAENELSLSKFDAVPNPFNDQIKVVYELEEPFENGQIIVTNILGEIVSSASINLQKDELFIGKSINMSGIYFLQIKVDGRNSKAMKLVRY